MCSHHLKFSTATQPLSVMASSSAQLPPTHPASSQAQAQPSGPPAHKEGDCWILPLKDRIPDPTSLVDFPWRECSTIAIHISPRYDSPDPSQAPMLDLNHAEPYMKAVTNRAVSVSAVLKEVLQEDINAGTMAIKVVFGEC